MNLICYTHIVLCNILGQIFFYLKKSIITYDVHSLPTFDPSLTTYLILITHYVPYFRHYQNALGCVARDILTIPLLKSRHNVLSPLLQSLSREDGAGLLLALRGMSDSTVTCQGGDHLQDKFLQKVHFLNNYCTCALSVTPDGHVFQDGLRMLVTSSSSSSEIPGSSSSSIPSPDASSTSSSSSSSSLGGAGPLDSGKKRGGSWIESVCDTLFALPLVMILNRMPGVLVPDHGIVSVEGKASDEGQSDAMQVVNEEIDDSDPLPGTEDLRVADQAFALAGGVKRLEYRLSAVLGVIRSRESIAFRALRSRAGVEKRQNTATASAKSSASSIAATAHVSSDSKKPRASYTTDRYAEMKRKGEPVHLNSALLAMDTIVRVLTANNAVSILTDAITSTCNSENILSLFAVVKVYSKILMSCPSGLEAAHTEALPLSISILNAMAFSRPKDPLTRRLWSLINSFDATVLTEAFSKAPTTASAATAASSAIASSATYATTQIGFNVTRTSSSSSSSVGAGGGAGGGTSSVPLLYLSSTMQAAARHGITPSELCEGLQSCLYLLCCVLSHQLTATDDEEFFGLVQGAGAAVGPSTGSGSGPMSEAGTSFKTLPLKDIILLIPVLKNILYKLYWNHPFPENAEHSAASSDSATMLCDLQVTPHMYAMLNSTDLYCVLQRNSMHESGF